MYNKLQPIILEKQQEVIRLRQQISSSSHHPIIDFLNGKLRRESHKSFKSALCLAGISVIAEIKRQSPSKGKLASIEQPDLLGKEYANAGARAISVLTDQKFFNGSLEDLKSVATALKNYSQPILRKDFVIDEIQIAEAITAGADAILAIVAVLGKNTKSILEAAKRMGIDVLVEIHDESELDIALSAGAEIIGVNNRDLSSFNVDVHQAFRLIQHIPQHVVKVAESGISEPSLVREYHQAGFDAVLIGEALVKTPEIDKFIRACSHEYTN